MMFNIFSEKKEKPEFFIVLDIGTEAIKSLICYKNPQQSAGKTAILGASLKYFDKEALFASAKLGREKAKKEISGAVEEARRNLCFTGEDKKIKEQFQRQKQLKIVLNLSADILRARVFKHTIKRGKNTGKISRLEEESILKQVFKNAQEEISNNFAKEFCILPKEIQWVSLKILEFVIDGYRIPSLQGYAGEDIEFRVLTTFLPKQYFENITKSLEDIGLRVSAIISEAEAFNPLYFSEMKNGIYLDIGGEVTQMIFVENNMPLHIDEFAVGGKAFSRAIAQHFGTDEESARLLKENYSNKVLSAGACQKVSEVFVQGQRAWYESFAKKIDKFKPQSPFLPPVFLMGGGSSLPEIQILLKGEAKIGVEQASSLATSAVSFLLPADLGSIRDLTNKINGPQYAPAALICSYASKIL